MESVSAAIDAIPSMKESLRRAFDDLEPFVSSLAGFSLRWDEIGAHFDARFNSVKRRLDELADGVKSKTSLPASIEKKDETRMEADDVKSKTSSPASIEKKDETTMEADDVKSKTSLPSSIEKKDETTMEADDVKSKTSLPASIEKEDETTMEADDVESKTSLPASIEKEDETTMEADDVKSKTSLPASIERKDETTVKADGVKLTNSSPASVEKEEVTVVADSWQAPPKLKLICSNMDDCALTLYVIENDSDLLSFREKEIVLALRFAPDPVKLVLDFMDGFEPDEVDAAKDTEGSALLRGSFRFLAALAELKPHVSIPVKERAKAIATKWRKRVQKLHDAVGADRNAVAFAVQVYVKLVATYGLISDVGLDELTEIVQRGSQYKGMMKLCRQLGLSDRMPGVIERLSAKRDYLPAVEIAHLFGLCEKYPPMPMLNKYVQDVKSKYYSVMGKGDKKSRVEAINKKLEAYRLLIITIKKCNIDDFPVSSLKLKMTHLKGQREKELMAMISPRVEQKKPKQQQSPMIVPSSAAPVPYIPDLPVDKISKEQNNSPGSLPALTPQAHDSIRAGAAISARAAGRQPQLFVDSSSLSNPVFEQKGAAGSSFRASHTMPASFDSYRLERYLPADRPPVPSIPDLPVDKISKEQNNSPGSLAALTPQAHDSIRAGAAISARAAGRQPELFVDGSSLSNPVFEQKGVAGSSFRASHTMAASFDSYRLERYLPADRPSLTSLMDRSSYDPYRAQHQDDPFNSRQDSFGRSQVSGSYWSAPRPISGLSSDSRNVRRRTDAILVGERLYHPSDAFDNSRSRDNGSDSFSGTTASRYHSDFLLGNPFIPPSS